MYGMQCIQVPLGFNGSAADWPPHRDLSLIGERGIRLCSQEIHLAADSDGIHLSGLLSDASSGPRVADLCAAALLHYSSGFPLYWLSRPWISMVQALHYYNSLTVDRYTSLMASHSLDCYGPVHSSNARTDFKSCGNVRAANNLMFEAALEVVQFYLGLSSPQLDDAPQRAPQGGGAGAVQIAMAIPRKALAIIGVVVVLSIVGVIIGVVVSKGSSSSSSSTSAGTSASSSGESSTTATGSYSGNAKVSASKESTGSGSSTITSNPTSAKYSLAAFAIGDWGTTTTQGSCCSRSATFNNYDINAEDVVANVMNQQAGKAEVAPKIVIGHGDNFYWNGINSADGRDSRFTTTFEDKYDGSNIKTIPWVNVLGNHDYGGADFICNSDNSPAKCSTTDELMTALKNKYSWQATYTSPNDNRWVLEDHFYVYSIEDSASGVSIDVFNVDSGDADSHGAMEVCCQCYGYADGSNSKCDNVARGDDVCCDGDTDMYDKCFAQFTAWSDESRKQLKANIANSTATWKVVNSHYSPYAHYDQTVTTTHHRLAYFLDNGAGGGIQKESAAGIPAYAKDAVENIWTYNGQEYGFFSLTASKDWLKLQYHTADDKWSYAKSFNASTIGGVATKHCWYVPNDGTEGKECSSSGSSSA
ncbi:unnamed protein product [Phytophthora fragariaefolia]|uniref:Unnamed protein product n=1 Tax=Phytophthora fragariaefolia TaxID=1490495 RepID=A0A9W6Y725_9STRA|nr:unnamed protein product [Phytophthora fragariaefolia]